MTSEQVLQLATLFAPGERFKLWVACGTHDLSALSPTATSDGGESLRYCERCLCVWAADGAVLNQPKGHQRDGVTGPQGPPRRQGPSVPAPAGELQQLAADVALVAKELQTQLTRITQIQAQLDRVAGQEPGRRDRRAAGRFEH